MSEPRRFLCRSGTAFSREAVYQAGDGLEIDMSEHFEVVRRRVLYDDVRLVTIHSDRGVWYLVITALIGVLFSLMGMYIVGSGPHMWPLSIMFFVFGIPGLWMFLVRMMFGRDIITIFGRRSKAVLRFTALRQRRARKVYGEICAAVRRAQAPPRGEVTADPTYPLS